MKLVTIIQARMGSTRLPGKVMLDLWGKTVLARVVERVRRSKFAGNVVVATTTEPAADAIVGECRRLGTGVFRGSEDDVLDRYYRAAKQFGAEAIIRICSDCPLVEPEIVDKTVQAFLKFRPDYVSNALERTYPRGLDTEIMTWDALAKCWREAQVLYQRSHVTPYIYENPDRFDILRVKDGANHGHHRWTLDTPEDLAFIRAVYARMQDPDMFSWRDVLQLLQREPEMLELNQHILQKALQEG